MKNKLLLDDLQTILERFSQNKEDMFEAMTIEKAIIKINQLEKQLEEYKARNNEYSQRYDYTDHWNKDMGA